MQKLFYVAVTAASIIASAAPGPAVASPIDFVLNGATVTYSSGNTYNLTGDFMFDPTTTTLSSISISQSGTSGNNPGPDFFTIATAATASSVTGASLLDAQSLTIAFLANLDGVPDPLQSIMTSGPDGAFSSIAVTGTANPVGAVTPIPPAITFFGTALALFALGLYGRNLRMGISFSNVQRLA